MLFLKHAADQPAEDASAAQLPVDDSLAAHLERALLAGDEPSRQRELATAAAANAGFSHWLLRTAEARQHRTVNRLEQATAWLAPNLSFELAQSLVESTDSALNEAQWRLAALVKKLAECNRVVSEFDMRLEREKLEAMKELAYGASHEVNNPLANIAARAQTLLEDEEDPQRRQKLIAIHRQSMRAHEMIADLMLFARPPKLSKAQLFLAGFVQRIIDQLSRYAEENKVQLSSRIDESSLTVFADETQLGVAIHALIKNAVEAAGDDGMVRVNIRKTQADHKLFAEIIVADDGPGIPPKVRRHIFEPFFSGREAGRGLGFGLSKCWRIVTEHGGQVIVGQSGGRGTEISVLLPLLFEQDEPNLT